MRQVNQTVNEGMAVLFGWGNVGSTMQADSGATPSRWVEGVRGELPTVITLLKCFGERYPEAASLMEFLVRRYARSQLLDALAPSPRGHPLWWWMTHSSGSMARVRPS